MPKNRKKNMPRPAAEEPYIKDFLDMVAPSVIDFKVDHYLCGNTCRCVWALREYPTSTDEQAILRHLGEMDGVTIRIYTRQVTPSEERRIIHNAANKHRMSRSSTEDLQQTVTAEANLQDEVPYDEEKPFDEYVMNLHNYITDLKNMEVHTGLHIMGQPPESKAMEVKIFGNTKDSARLST